LKQIGTPRNISPFPRLASLSSVKNDRCLSHTVNRNI
jgi:hypothetical protein